METEITGGIREKIQYDIIFFSTLQYLRLLSVEVTNNF